MLNIKLDIKYFIRRLNAKFVILKRNLQNKNNERKKVHEIQVNIMMAKKKKKSKT